MSQRQWCSQCQPLCRVPDLFLAAAKGRPSCGTPSASRNNTKLLYQSSSPGRGISAWQRRVTKNISISLHHSACCHWHLDEVLLANHVVEGKVFAPQWNRAGMVRNCPSDARKGKEKDRWEREKRKGRRGMKTTCNHRDSNGTVILYTEISFSTDVRVLSSHKKIIFCTHLKTIITTAETPSSPQCLCGSQVGARWHDQWG